MKMTLSHSFAFYAQHSLDEFPRSHGHAYCLTVFIEGEPISGMVAPLDEIGLLVMPVIHEVAYTNLNDIIDRPTLERILIYLAGKIKSVLPGLVCVRLEREYDTAIEVET